MFKKRLLTQGGSKDMSEVHYLSVNFTGQQEFVGNKLPDTFDIGSYYTARLLQRLIRSVWTGVVVPCTSFK